MMWSYRFKNDQNKTSSNLTNRIHTKRHTLLLRYINTSVYRLSSSNTNDKWWPCSFLISEAAVVGRGCSTKDKVFYKECETHSYGDNLEKMCFCSFQLCNRSAIQLNCPSIWTLTLLTLSTVFLSASWTGLLVASAAATTASVTASGWVWDPWPPFTHASNVGNRIQPQVVMGHWYERYTSNQNFKVLLMKYPQSFKSSE